MKPRYETNWQIGNYKKLLEFCCQNKLIEGIDDIKDKFDGYVYTVSQEIEYQKLYPVQELCLQLYKNIYRRREEGDYDQMCQTMIELLR